MIEIRPTLQPDIPALRNNKQREKFLEDYRFWPVWFRTSEASEVCYRYGMPDGTAIAVRETKAFSEWNSKEYVKLEWYHLQPGYRYLADCHSSKTQLVNYLKEVQKS